MKENFALSFYLFFFQTIHFPVDDSPLFFPDWGLQIWTVSGLCHKRQRKETIFPLKRRTFPISYSLSHRIFPRCIDDQYIHFKHFEKMASDVHRMTRRPVAVKMFHNLTHGTGTSASKMWNMATSLRKPSQEMSTRIWIIMLRYDVGRKPFLIRLLRPPQSLPTFVSHPQNSHLIEYCSLALSQSRCRDLSYWEKSCILPISLKLLTTN